MNCNHSIDEKYIYNLRQNLDQIYSLLANSVSIAKVFAKTHSGESFICQIVCLPARNPIVQ